MAAVAQQAAAFARPVPPRARSGSAAAQRGGDKAPKARGHARSTLQGKAAALRSEANGPPTPRGTAAT